MELNYNDLYEKYIELRNENIKLKIEIQNLRNQFGIINEPLKVQYNINETEINQELNSEVNNKSDVNKKIELYMSLFRGREDVYAKRFENKKTDKPGYAPVCKNEWIKGICNKKVVKCFECQNKNYSKLDKKAIELHLRGKEVLGIFPMLKDESCYFLAIDFDDEGWESDVTVIREICDEHNISHAVERSRSGNGAHVWFFFKENINAALARKFGTAILTYAMEKRYEIQFKSYDRLFPNQDTMPKGGFGNLIALPLQKNARAKFNSEFIDEDFKSYEDQWAYLSNINKLSKEEIEDIIKTLAPIDEMGYLIQDHVEVEEDDTITINVINNEEIQDETVKNVNIKIENMIYVEKAGLTNKTLNTLKRIASFRNPEFYQAQRMRLPTYNKPRVISLVDDSKKYLCLPRGCEEELINLFNSNKINVNKKDDTFLGKTIDVDFNGTLREEQINAAEEMLKHDNGILSATTAFGKTVIGANIISIRKVNTLIIVHTQQLLEQWIARSEEFLIINEVLPDDNTKKRGRKKKVNLVGQLGAGKNKLSGIIDVATMQSLVRGGEVKELVKDYGMVIVDECHHVSAFSLEQILKNVRSKYVYGLTATPTRKDGHQPIIYMQCGPIRYRVDPIKQAEKRPFEHYVIPRLTNFKLTTSIANKTTSITDIYSELTVSETRNKTIIEDVINCVKEGRNPIILTERTAHVEVLSNLIKASVSNVVILTGAMSKKEKNTQMDKLRSIPKEESVVIVATGKFVGEGFDEPRLDTLFLVMPISWKGTLQQYAGRLHRLYDDKNEVQIYDYVDIYVGVLERMYQRRLKGYDSIGYYVKSDSKAQESKNFIYNNSNFFESVSKDIYEAKSEIIIVSPFIRKRRLLQILSLLEIAKRNNVYVQIITSPVSKVDKKYREVMTEIFELIKSRDIEVIFKHEIYQRFVVIDGNVSWYGNIDVLSYDDSHESIMRLDSAEIAQELLSIYSSVNMEVNIQQKLF